MYLIILFLIIIILILIAIIFLYQRQMKNVCRQLLFLKEIDSNMMITGEIWFGGFDRLISILNDFLKLRKKERKKYLEKEEIISNTYTNLSHDIRTPLTSLDGYFQLLEECNDPDKQRHYIKVIQERITSLKDMLEDLFAISKLKNDSYVLELSRCSLNRILKDILLSYYDNWKANEIDPEFNITDEPLWMEGNPQALNRLISNIIKNGIDYGEKKIKIDLKRYEDTIILSLKNMVSNPKEINIEQIFDKFYKGDKARNGNSTGLGLSIAKEFVILMNGEIFADIQNNWFCIKIVFPLLQET